MTYPRAFVPFFLVALCIAGAARTLAQQAKEIEPTGLAVEVNTGASPVAYVQVPHWAWFASFGRIKSGRAVPGAPPVRAVRIDPAVVPSADVVRVKVSVLLGERYMDREELVATYDLREGEPVEVKELTRYGVVPFGLKLVSVRPFDWQPPEVVNQTRSLTVLGIEPKAETFPAYRIRVRNTAAQSVVALFLYAYTDPLLPPASQMPHNELNLPLIEPGAVHELIAVSGTGERSTPAGDVKPEPLRKVVIAAALFADGRYEGDAARAAYIRAFGQGTKVQLARVLALIKLTLAEPDLDAPAAVARFKAQVAALDEVADAAATSTLRAEFPALNAHDSAALADVMQFMQHRLKLDLLKAVMAFEQGQARTPGAETFGGWLRETQGAYERWRARL